MDAGPTIGEQFLAMGYSVKRLPDHGVTVKMSRGYDDTFDEPRFHATVFDPRGRIVGTVGNSTTLALPNGRTKRAPEASDADIIEAVACDEPIFGTRGATSAR